MLLLCLLTMSMLMGVLVLVVGRGERKSLALRWWGWGLITYACGMLVIISSFWLPYDLTQVVGNSLISLGGLFTARGVFMHVPERPHLRFTGGLLGAVVVGLTLNHVFFQYAILDIALPTFYASLLYAVVSWQLIRHPPPAARTAARFLVTTILLTLVVWNLRLLAIWLMVRGSADPSRGDALQAGFAIFQMLLVVCSTLGLMWVEVRLMEDDLRRSAFTDLLTGLPNRRAMDRLAERELRRRDRYPGPLSILMIDVDHFKSINERYLLPGGDKVLTDLARALKASIRDVDSLGRIGGEEFLVILPQHDREQCIRAADRLRQAVEGTRPHEEAATPTATLSGGVAMFPEDGEDWDRLYMAADRRMYRAKRAGRNQVEGRDE